MQGKKHGSNQHETVEKHSFLSLLGLNCLFPYLINPPPWPFSSPSCLPPIFATEPPPVLCHLQNLVPPTKSRLRRLITQPCSLLSHQHTPPFTTESCHQHLLNATLTRPHEYQELLMNTQGIHKWDDPTISHKCQSINRHPASKEHTLPLKAESCSRL